LLDKEKYIPHELGTRGFIDLYARDVNGHHVLIELKRSNEASREALHEVYKYVEGVKQHLGVRDDEIRVIVASTEWRELLVPFSRFAADSRFAVLGLRIDLAEFPQKGMAAYPVSLLSINQGRFIAPWHDVNWYLDEASLEKGVESIEKSCQAKGIKNYVITILRFATPPGSEHQAAMWESIRQMAELQGLERASPEPELPTYRFIAYFAMQLTNQECLGIIDQMSAEPDEIRESIEDMDEEAALGYLHESVGALEPRPKQDHYEIGYPAKLIKFLDDFGGEVTEIRRYGIFSRNLLLSDESILSELKGEDGSTGQKFKRTVSVTNRAHMASARADIGRCLEQNAVWRGHLMRILDEVESEFPEAEIDISIFNPATGILTLYFSTIRDDGILYIPSYHLVVKNPSPTRMYYGGLDSAGNPMGFQKLLEKYYGNSISGLLLTMTWGGRESRDLDIVEDMGLAYRSFRCELDERGGKDFFELRDERWRSRGAVNHLQLFDDYLGKNESFVRLVVQRIAERHNGGLIDASSAERMLEDVADVDRGKLLGRYFIGAPENCDVCDCSLEDCKFMVDGPVGPIRGAWGCMCGDCFVFGGGKIGVGTGQLYLNEEGEWLLVGGFPPDEEDDPV
jgi:hypothetical protein